jgi:hypothetical protein
MRLLGSKLFWVGFLLLSLPLSAETTNHNATQNSQTTSQHNRPISKIESDSGVQFNCSKEQLDKLKKDFDKLFADYGWLGDSPQVKTRISADKQQLNLSLNTSRFDTDTLSLKDRANLKITEDIDIFIDRKGTRQEYKVASEKEIVAAMLQNGRLFEFDRSFCTFEKFIEHVKIRKNIIRWGIRAMWEFPEAGEKYDKKFWAADFKLQPGIKSSEAIADAFTGKVDYEIGCTKACQKIMAQGILDYYKNVKKDAKMIEHLDGITAPTPLDTMEMIVNGESKSTMVREGTLVDRHFKVPANHWVPGDWGWIKNPDEESAEENGLEGCNIIYIGHGLFVVYYGTDPDRTLDEALVRVYQWRRDSKEEPITPDFKRQLRKDPRSGGLLRDVRDFPKNFHQEDIGKTQKSHP